jgi:hypothetical protein
MGLTDSYQSAADVADLLEAMVARREKIFASVPVVGRDVAKSSYDDVAKVIDSAKAIFSRLALPRGNETNPRSRWVSLMFRVNWSLGRSHDGSIDC